MIRNFLDAQKFRLTQWLKAILQLRHVYKAVHGRQPNIFWPRRYTDKMQWRKLFDTNPIYTLLSDKLAVRNFIAARVGDSYHIPILWIGQPDDIPFESIEPPYVIKSNHASGQVIMVADRESIDPPAIRQTTASWLAMPYGVNLEEPAYWDVPPQLFIQRMLLTQAGTPPEEYRIFLFDGKTVFIQTTINNNGKIRHGAFHTPQWMPRDWYFSLQHNRVFPRPERLAEMIRIAEILGREFDHLRVDFLDDGDAIWLGELTVYSWSGLAIFHPDEADFELGSHWRLRAPLFRALSEIFLRRRAIPRPK